MTESGSAALLRAVDAVYAAVDAEDFGRAALQALRTVAGYDVATYNETYLDDDRLVAAFEPTDLRPRGDDLDVLLRLHRQHPLIGRFARIDEPRVTRWSDVQDVRAFWSTELFSTYYRALGVRQQAGIKISGGGGAIISIALSRARRDFRDQERDRLEILRPHLRRAYGVARRRADAELLARWAAEDGATILRLDAAGRIDEHRGARLPGLRHGELLPWPLRRAVQRARAGRPATTIETLDGVTVRVRVVRDGGAREVVVLRASGERATRLDALGLTERQLDIALALAEGGTNAEIGARLGIAEGTVRKHLERIYTVLGVSDRASAIAAVVATDVGS